MTRQPVRFASPIALVGVALVAACGGAPVKTAPTELGLSDFAIAAPASIPASMATFSVVNKGTQAHQAALVRLDSGKTYADFQAAIMDTTHKGPPPAWIVWMGGTHAFPGATNEFAVNLEAGSYVWYCMIPGPDGIPHMAKGMSSPMKVTAAAGAAAAAPASDIDVTTKDYTWDFSTPPTAGKHVLKVSVAPGAQSHEMVMIKLPAGKTGQDFVNWAMKMQGPPPADALYGVGTMQTGQVNYVTVDFAAGNYAIICFVPDEKDGVPHAMHGMVKDFTVQ